MQGSGFNPSIGKKKKKEKVMTRHSGSCLMPVILATWGVEIKRILIPGQPEKIVLKTPSPK
jgi:hypothetical protein